MELSYVDALFAGAEKEPTGRARAVSVLTEKTAGGRWQFAQRQVVKLQNAAAAKQRRSPSDYADVEMVRKALIDSGLGVNLDARAIKELPNEREIPELLRRISSIGKKIGLEFLLFQPLPEVPREFYADVPVKLKIEGSFHEVATFFDRIGKLNRIVNIRDISMSSPFERSGKIILTTDGTAVTYRFLSDSERAPPSQRGRR